MKNENYKEYVRTGTTQMRPYIPGEPISDKLSISDADKKNGSPRLGDMIARNKDNPDDQWLVAAQYFRDNFKEAK